MTCHQQENASRHVLKALLFHQILFQRGHDTCMHLRQLHVLLSIPMHLLIVRAPLQIQ